MNIIRSSAILIFCAIASNAHSQSPTPAGSPGYPAKPIRYVVPSPAGSSLDTTSRIIAQQLSAAFAQSVAVDNRPGAAGNIGVDLVAKSTPDGYTLLQLNNGSLAASPALYRNLPFDPARDLAPVAQVSAMPFVMLVHPSLPTKTLKEFIQLARARPGQISYGASGIGALDHLTGELFNSMARIQTLFVAYKGSPAFLNDLIGGRISMAFAGLVSGVPHLKSGRLRGLAVTASKRAALLPDMPTMAESGLPGYEVINSSAIYAPANTPKAIVAKLNEEVDKILRRPDVRERFAGLGVEPVGGTPEELGAVLRADIAKWKKVVEAAGISAAN